MPKNTIILRVCDACRLGFLARADNVKIGWGRYCSRRCVSHRHGASAAARLHARTRRGPDCWEWTGGRDSRGYGSIRVARTGIGAHRLAWQVAYGPIPPGMAVLHRCDNPPCVRPAHLFLGSQADNNRDMRDKGRHQSSRLSAGDVRLIRSLHAAGGTTQVDLGRRFGVTQFTIWMVVHRKSWRDIE